MMTVPELRLQTVTGLIPVDAVQLADAHSHLWIKPPPDVDPDAPQLDDYDNILAELVQFRDGGGTTLIDCQPPGCGRDVRVLLKLADATGLHITAVTGFHLRKYYPPKSWLWSATETQAADFFIEELKGGMNETGGQIPATAIKVGYEGFIDGQVRALMEAAAEAARQTGAAILFHTEAGRNVEALLPFFNDRGVPPRRLYLCHVDKRPDAGLHHELAQAGALLGYDTFLRRKYNPDQNLWPLIRSLVDAGFDDRIAMGLDLALPSMWVFGGAEWGLMALPRLILPRLQAEGYRESIIQNILGQNVARHLAWEVR